MKTASYTKLPEKLRAINLQTFHGMFEDDWEEKARQLQLRRWQAIKREMSRKS